MIEEIKIFFGEYNDSRVKRNPSKLSTKITNMFKSIW